MKFCVITSSDAIHAQIEKMTNPLAPERVPTGKVKIIVCPLTEQTSDALNLFSHGKERTGQDDYKKPAKSYLCNILLTGYYKAWQKMPSETRSKELQELRNICAMIRDDMRKAVGQNVGTFKVTKRLMFSAILHRLAITQDLKTFFDKTL